MLIVKQEAIKTINQLPEDVDIDEIMYQLYVLDKIRKGQQAIELQHILSSRELQQEIDLW